MFTREIHSLTDQLTLALLDHLRLALANLATSLTDSAIFDPEDPELETTYENALNGEGVALTPIITQSTDGTTCTYAIAIVAEVAWANIRAREPIGRNARWWAEWAMTQASLMTPLEVTDALRPIGVEDATGTDATEIAIARLETKTLWSVY